MSDAFVCVFPCHSSGARKYGVPTCSTVSPNCDSASDSSPIRSSPPVTVVENFSYVPPLISLMFPKSPSLAELSCIKKTFSDLISLWMKFRECK